MTNDRKFGNTKTEEKVYALALWRDGASIASIAKDLGRTRETIYRWVRAGDRMLGKGKNRKRITIDDKTKSHIIEAYVLMKCPSIRALRSTLASLYFIQLSEPQLRRALKKWGLDSFRPSSIFDSMMRHQLTERVALKRKVGANFSVEISPKSVEHFSHPSP